MRHKSEGKFHGVVIEDFEGVGIADHNSIDKFGHLVDVVKIDSEQAVFAFGGDEAHFDVGDETDGALATDEEFGEVEVFTVEDVPEIVASGVFGDGGFFGPDEVEVVFDKLIGFFVDLPFEGLEFDFLFEGVEGDFFEKIFVAIS